MPAMTYTKKLSKAKHTLLCTLCLTTLPAVGLAAENADMNSYTLDEDIVVAERVAEKPETTAVASDLPAKEDDQIAGGLTAKKANYGALGERDVMSTPFNMTTFTDKMIQDRQAANVNDVIANDASASDQTLSGASQAWSIRGFRSQQQDVSFNGLYGVAPRFYSGVEGLDRVEILKGPGALLYGMAPNGSVGGNINFVPKRAKSGEYQNSVTLSFGDGRQFGQNLDIGTRSKDDVWGVRANIFHTNGSTSIDDEKVGTSTIFLGVDRKGEKTRTSFDFGHINNNIKNMQYRLTFGSGFLGVKDIPSADNDKKYGAPDTHRKIHETLGVLRFERDLTPDTMLYASAGMRYTDMDYVYNDFRLNATGTASIRYHANSQVNKANSEEIGVKTKFVTGALKHELTLAANRYQMKRYMSNRTGAYFATSYFAPDWGTNTLDRSWQDPLNDQTNLFSMALTDVITTANDHWTFILGGRHQSIRQETYVSNTKYDENVWTPAVGTVYKVNNKVSVYANYIEGLTPGDVVSGGYDNDGDTLAPYKAKQLETGVKFDMGKALATFSAFQITQDGEMETADGKRLTTSGEVRHRGLEASVYGEPVDGTRLWGSLMYMQAKYTEDLQYRDNDRMGIPRWTAVAGAEQDIYGIKGLSINTRLTYNGSSYVNQENTTKVPSWIRWDLGSRYEFNWGKTPMTLRADVFNVMNKSYWSSMSNSSAVYNNKGRTFMVSLEAKF